MNHSDDYTRHPVSAEWTDQTEEQYDALKARIGLVGFTDPIIVLPDGRIVDGWHRFLACGDLGIEPVFEVRDLDPVQVAECSITAHRGRRNLTPGALVESSIKALLAAGLDFAERGDNQFVNADGETVGTITRKRLEDLTGASVSTIKRVLATFKPDPDPPADDDDDGRDPFDPDPPADPDTPPGAASDAPPADPPSTGTGTPADDGSAGERAPATPSGDPDPKPPSRFDALKTEYRAFQDETNATVRRLESELDRERAAKAALEERIAILEAESEPGTREAIDQANNRENLVASLKSQLNERAAEVGVLKKERTALKGKLTKATNRIAELEAAAS